MNSGLLTPDEQERAIKRLLIQEAKICGPSVARLIQHLWADNILEMIRDARQLLDLSRRYSPTRLQAACRRAIYYRKDRPTSPESVYGHQRAVSIPF